MLCTGLPRYCSAITMPDGTFILNGGLSRRGKPRGPPGSKTLSTALKGCDDPLFLDFVGRCLEWDPELRMTPSAALRHGWLRRRLPRPPASDSASLGLRTPAPRNNTLTSVNKARAVLSDDRANTIHSRHSQSYSSGKFPQLSGTALPST